MPNLSAPKVRELKRRLKLEGMRAVDMRFGPGKAIFRWRASVIAALGGEENVTPQKLVLIEDCCRTKLILDHVDKVVLQRMSIAEHLNRVIAMIGLERIEKHRGVLDDYIVKVEPKYDEAEERRADEAGSNDSRRDE